MTRDPKIELFEIMMDEVADNLEKAYFHIKLYRQLKQELDSPENLKIYSDSKIFWDKTLHAHYQVGIMALMKVYDSRDKKDVITIKAILEDIKSFHTSSNKTIHTSSNKTILKSEQIKQLDEDISHVNCTKPKNSNFKELKTGEINGETGSINPTLKPVDKLNNIRSRKFAHSSKQSGSYQSAKIVAEYQKTNQALTPEQFNDLASCNSYAILKDLIETSLSLDEVTQLINEGIEICNRYREIFDMPAITTNLDGDDDYKKIFALP